jgi:hypothetical protein
VGRDPSVVQLPLLVEGRARHQPLESVAQPGIQREIAAEAAGDESGEPAVVERVAGVGVAEPPAVAIPEGAGERRQLVAEQLAVELVEPWMAARAEEQEEIVEREPPDAGELELEQGVLAGIGVDRVDRGRAGERVVARCSRRS